MCETSRRITANAKSHCFREFREFVIFVYSQPYRLRYVRGRISRRSCYTVRHQMTSSLLVYTSSERMTLPPRSVFLFIVKEWRGRRLESIAVATDEPRQGLGAHWATLIGTNRTAGGIMQMPREPTWKN